jgi:hypothetical protein
MHRSTRKEVGNKLIRPTKLLASTTNLNISFLVGIQAVLMNSM